MNDTTQEVTVTWEERFVRTLFERIAADKGFAARMRRADNPSTEYQSWEFLAAMGVDLEKEYLRLPFVTVAAAVAKSDAQRNGPTTLGQAIAACYETGKEADQAKARLRRLLACDDLPEVCRILRGTFSLIDSKAGRALDYVRILRQLRSFSYDPQRIKAQWAQEFYGRSAGGADEEKEASGEA